MQVLYPVHPIRDDAVAERRSIHYKETERDDLVHEGQKRSRIGWYSQRSAET